ncbi:MAG: hypothetical protein CXZ00_00775 [Acidobacteria bacterium]|nr:MAG: hypothetical protein CXZ00_00775 [Acidobacteriota bacterium]
MQRRGFDEGSAVLLTLHSPREKVFGLLIKLAAEGVELRGIPVESLDEVARQVRAGERAGALTLFFPMHRVERMELDAAVGELPSLAESFAAKAGCAVREAFEEATGGNEWA